MSGNPKEIRAAWEEDRRAKRTLFIASASAAVVAALVAGLWLPASPRRPLRVVAIACVAAQVALAAALAITRWRGATREPVPVVPLVGLFMMTMLSVLLTFRD